MTITASEIVGRLSSLYRTLEMEHFFGEENERIYEVINGLKKLESDILKECESATPHPDSKRGFPAVVNHLGHCNCLHLSSSAYGEYYIPEYFPKHGTPEELTSLTEWFGEEVAKLLIKLKPGEGIHCYLVPCPATLTSSEIKSIAEHDTGNLVTLDELKERQ